jgi:hypothetical protein
MSNTAPLCTIATMFSQLLIFGIRIKATPMHLLRKLFKRQRGLRFCLIEQTLQHLGLRWGGVQHQGLLNMSSSLLFVVFKL